MRSPERGNLPRQRHRIGNQPLDRNILIGDLVDEARIGPVLQQPPHQIGQQRLMAPHRRIDTAGAGELVLGHHLFIERFAHAVQALELVIPDFEVRPGQRMDRRHGLRVVGRKLRKHHIPRRQEFFGACKIAHIGMHLAGEHWKIGLPVKLGALDLAVPIGALDQPHHDPVPRTARQIDDPVDDIGAALGIGLHHEPDTVPAVEFRIGRQRLEQIERKFEPVHLLGIDIEPDVIALGQPRQFFQSRQQFPHRARILRPRIAWMQRRKLYRNARTAIGPALVRSLADGVDRPDIVGHVAVRVSSGGRRFPQHVVGIAEPLGLPGPGMLERLPDGLAGDELLAQHAHRHLYARTDHRLA